MKSPLRRQRQRRKRIFTLAREKGLVCMPNQNRRFDADFLALKSVIDSGKLGELVRLESHYDYSAKMAGMITWVRCIIWVYIPLTR